MTYIAASARPALKHLLGDLGTTAWTNWYLRGRTEAANAHERAYPAARPMVCAECLLVQPTETVPADEIFNDAYAYFSSFSPGWVGSRPPATPTP